MHTWPALGEYDLDLGCMRSDAEPQFAAGADFTDASVSASQKALSSKIQWPTIRFNSHLKAHLLLNRNPGAGTWPPSLPNSPDTHLSSPATPPQGHLGRRLHLPSVWANAGPLLSCTCGGDRVCRHNAVRDVVHSIAQGQLFSSLRSKKSKDFFLLVLPTMGTLLFLPPHPTRPAATLAALPICGISRGLSMQAEA